MPPSKNLEIKADHFLNNNNKRMSLRLVIKDVARYTSQSGSPSVSHLWTRPVESLDVQHSGKTEWVSRTTHLGWNEIKINCMRLDERMVDDCGFCLEECCWFNVPFLEYTKFILFSQARLIYCKQKDNFHFPLCHLLIHHLESLLEYSHSPGNHRYFARFYESLPSLLRTSYSRWWDPGTLMMGNRHLQQHLKPKTKNHHGIQLKTCELFVSEMFHLIFFCNNWSWVDEITENKNKPIAKWFCITQRWQEQMSVIVML